MRAWGPGPPGRRLAALTLLKFIQAAGAAEGAHGGRLPAAASLHPRGWAASEQPGATWRRARGLAQTHAQLARRAARRRRRALAGPGAALPQCTTAALPPATQYTRRLTPSAPRELRGARAAPRQPPFPPPRAQPTPACSLLSGATPGALGTPVPGGLPI